MNLTMSENSLYTRLEILGQAQLNLAKTETKWLKTEMKLMTVVLGEWWITTEIAELEVGKSIYAWSGCWEPEPT